MTELLNEIKKSYMIHEEPRQKHNMKELPKNGETIVHSKTKILILQTVVYPEGFRCWYAGLGTQTMCPNY